jgi:hypothetical protein
MEERIGLEAQISLRLSRLGWFKKSTLQQFLKKNLQKLSAMPLRFYLVFIFIFMFLNIEKVVLATKSQKHGWWFS